MATKFLDFSLAKLSLAVIFGSLMTIALFIAENAQSPSVRQITTAVTSKPFTVSQKVVVSPSQTNSYDVTLTDGSTLLEALKLTPSEAEAKTDLTNTKVDSLAGIKNGAGNKVWNAYVNNSRCPTTIDRFVVKPGDAIEWRLEAK